MSGSEIGMEVGASGGENEKDGIWHTQKGRRKRKKTRKLTESSQSDKDEVHSAGLVEVATEFKVVVKLIKEGESFSKWNPVKLTKEINTLVGKVKCAKILRDGSLLIICNDVKHKERALSMSKVLGENVSGKLLDRGKYLRGVITGIPPEVPVEEIKTNVSGGKVVEVRRLKMNRNGERSDSFSVMLKFEERVLPDKVYVGYMSYGVRPFIPPPLRCFKCQKFGHVAAVCKGKQRCGRCAGDHEYGKCEEGAALKCCNCGGEHSSAYRGCTVSKRAEEVQKVKIQTGVSFAEAARKIPAQSTVQVNKTAAVEACSSACQGCSKIKEDTLLMRKDDFVLFMVEIINCTAQVERKTEKIKIIVKAAQKYLGFKNTSWELVEERLNESQFSCQPQTWSGVPSVS